MKINRNYRMIRISIICVCYVYNINVFISHGISVQGTFSYWIMSMRIYKREDYKYQYKAYSFHTSFYFAIKGSIEYPYS